MTQIWHKPITPLHERLKNEHKNLPGRPYDLSFVYRIAWDDPALEIREAFRVLLDIFGLSSGGEPPLWGANLVTTQLTDEQHLRIHRLIASNPETPPVVLNH